MITISDKEKALDEIRKAFETLMNVKTNSADVDDIINAMTHINNVWIMLEQS